MHNSNGCAAVKIRLVAYTATAMVAAFPAFGQTLNQLGAAWLVSQQPQPHVGATIPTFNAEPYIMRLRPPPPIQIPHFVPRPPQVNKMRSSANSTPSTCSGPRSARSISPKFWRNSVRAEADMAVSAYDEHQARSAAWLWQARSGALGSRSPTAAAWRWGEVPALAQLP
jgi:hypothetical protein